MQDFDCCEPYYIFSKGNFSSSMFFCLRTPAAQGDPVGQEQQLYEERRKKEKKERKRNQDQFVTLLLRGAL